MSQRQARTYMQGSVSSPELARLYPLDLKWITANSPPQVSITCCPVLFNLIGSLLEPWFLCLFCALGK